MSDLASHLNNFVCLLILALFFVWALSKTVFGNVAVVAQNSKAIFGPPALFQVVIDVAIAYFGAVLIAVLVYVFQSKKFFVGFATTGANMAVGVKHFLSNAFAFVALATLDFFVMSFGLFFLVARPAKATCYMRSVRVAFGLNDVHPLFLIAVLAKPVSMMRSVGMAGRLLSFTARPVTSTSLDMPGASIVVDQLVRYAELARNVLVCAFLNFDLLSKPVLPLIRFFAGHLLTPSERCVMASKVFIPPGTCHIPRYILTTSAFTKRRLAVV